MHILALASSHLGLTSLPDLAAHALRNLVLPAMICGVIGLVVGLRGTTVIDLIHSINNL